MQVRYKAPPTIARFMQSNAPVRFLKGPYGSGKSSGCVMELLRRAQMAPVCRNGRRLSRFAVVRNTYPVLRDTTIKTFSEWIPEGPLGRFANLGRDFLLRFNDIECEILFRALDTPEDVKNLLSFELTGMWINEAKEIPKAIFEAATGRIARYPAARQLPDGVTYWSGIWMDSNPPDTDHWLYRLFEEERPPGYEVFSQPSGLAPDAENLENLRAPTGERGRPYYEHLAIGKDKDWVNVYVKGDYGFVKDGKPIYPEYIDIVHCSEAVRPNPGWPIIFGQDFGLTPAATLIQRDPRDGQLQVFDELVSDDMGAHSFGTELARLIKHDYPQRRVIGWGDPAGDQRAQTDETTPFQIMHAVGLETLAPAPTNDFTKRREAVACNLKRLTLMGRPGLIISPRCRTLRKAMAGAYCYRRLQVTGRDAYADKPDKNKFSHVAEALQYALVGEGEDSRAVDSGNYRTEAVPFKVIRAFGGHRNGNSG